MKYRIRQSTIVFSEQKAKQGRNKLVDIENKLRKSELLCATEPTENSIENIEKGKIKYDSMYQYTTQGKLYDTEPHGMKKVKKNSKYFVTLEKTEEQKIAFYSLFNKQGKEIFHSKAIMTESKGFYEDLYANKDSGITANDLENCSKNLNILNYQITCPSFAKDS